MRVLIIEDNPDIVANIYGFFEPLGYELDSAHNGYAGLAQAKDNEYDAIVLDVMLPGLDGYQLCSRLRNELRSKTPVLMLTARDTIENRVEGFDSGADDYLVKPFSLIELDARLKALVRRARDQHFDPVMVLGELSFDPETHEVLRKDQRLALTPTGFKLLYELMRASPKVMSKETLERAVWGQDAPNSDALRTHIHTLRQALDKPFSHPMLKTVAGVGYQLVHPNDSK